MRVFRSMRWLLLALLLPLIPASQAHAGVFISVGFGPPALPVYVQPICPQPGLMWTPGYWAYGPDGYYWVPGAWVPAPFVGGLWTPPYWGWSGGLYMFHPGYWGTSVGYYGGINYGFGYGGIGFAGGMWRGGVFAYNTAIMRVGSGGAWGNRVYSDRGAVDRGYGPGGRDSHVAYNGGQGGIRYQPNAQERSYMNQRHVAPTSFQTQHEQQARGDRTAYAKANNGRPANVVSNRPLQQENRPAPTQRPAQGAGNNARPGQAGGANRPAYNQTQRPAQENRPAQQRPAQESRPAQQRPAQQRPAQQSRPAAQPRQESRPAPQRSEDRPRR